LDFLIHFFNSKNREWNIIIDKKINSNFIIVIEKFELYYLRLNSYTTIYRHLDYWIHFIILILLNFCVRIIW